jgi:hypothetical protein
MSTNRIESANATPNQRLHRAADAQRAGSSFFVIVILPPYVSANQRLPADMRSSIFWQQRAMVFRL